MAVAASTSVAEEGMSAGEAAPALDSAQRPTAVLELVSKGLAWELEFKGGIASSIPARISA